MIEVGKIIEGIASIPSAVANFFGWKRDEANRQNTPEMQGNARAKDDASKVDEARKAVASEDVDEIRRKLS